MLLVCLLPSSFLLQHFPEPHAQFRTRVCTWAQPIACATHVALTALCRLCCRCCCCVYCYCEHVTSPASRRLLNAEKIIFSTSEDVTSFLEETRVIFTPRSRELCTPARKLLQTRLRV